MLKILASLFMIIFSFGELKSQKADSGSRVFVIGRIEKIYSSKLSETRELNIYLPAGYHPDSAREYPVIYLLDGSADEDFIHVAGIIQYLNFPWIDKLPKSILVGIANVDRKRDFTFPTHNQQDLKAIPRSGASALFIEFIEEELQPFIHARYKTSSQKTIIGESLGGLLATEILMKRPGLFDNYIIISPSLWWDNESLLRLGGQLLRKDHLSGVKVYLSIGNEGKQMVQDAEQLVVLIRKASPNGVKLFYYPFPKETHATIFHLSLYKAFEVLYKKGG